MNAGKGDKDRGGDIKKRRDNHSKIDWGKDGRNKDNTSGQRIQQVRKTRRKI